MQKTAIVPLYQKLMLGDVELDENEKTIEGLEIAPNTILNLITFDEDSEEVKKRNEEGKESKTDAEMCILWGSVPLTIL